MIYKGFLRNQVKRDSKDNRYISIASKSILYWGVFILISALIYMIINFSKTDSIINIWLPFMIAGVVLVFVSQLIKWQYVKLNR